MAIFKKYQNIAEPAIASYNHIDIASGTGYVNFFAGTASGAAVLSPNTFWSDRTMFVHEYRAGTNYAEFFDHDFDTTFTRPVIIKGDAVVCVPVGIYCIDDADNNFKAYVTAEISKDDGTETSLVGPVQSRILDAGIGIFAATTYRYYTATMFLTIPNTTFKVGDILRLTIKLYGKEPNNKATSIFYGCDPKGRALGEYSAGTGTTVRLTFGSDSSTLLFQVPFKLDI